MYIYYAKYLQGIITTNPGTGPTFVAGFEVFWFRAVVFGIVLVVIGGFVTMLRGTDLVVGFMRSVSALGLIFFPQ